MFFSSFNGISRLISKGMSNIYLKVTTERIWRSQIFNFLRLKNLSPGQFLGGAPTHVDMIEKRGHFLYRLSCLKEIFLTFVLYLNV